MVGKGKKISIERELKYAMPKDLRRKLRKALAQYGVGKALAEDTGITYQTIAAALKSGLATKRTAEALQQSLNQLEIAA